MEKAHTFIEQAADQQRAEKEANEKNEEEKLTLRAHTPKAFREVPELERELAKNEDEWELKDKKNRAIVLL